MILLDAFPGDRAATHATDYDADAFPAALTSRGFDVIRDSHSNYLETQLTLTSMFWMRHLVDIPALGRAVRPAVARLVAGQGGTQRLARRWPTCAPMATRSSRSTAAMLTRILIGWIGSSGNPRPPSSNWP